jgi:hypothetical protein
MPRPKFDVIGPPLLRRYTKKMSCNMYFVTKGFGSTTLVQNTQYMALSIVFHIKSLRSPNGGTTGFLDLLSISLQIT